jgi:hypothetical protein
MGRIIGWSAWAMLPVLGLAFHFGPGQSLLNRDLAVTLMRVAQAAEQEAAELQSQAHEAQFATLAARDRLLADDSDENRAWVEQRMNAEQQAYASASDAWKATAECYEQVESLLEGTFEANQVRLLRSRALVRAGEVFNGIDELESTLDAALEESVLTNPDPHAADLVLAAREELAAAHYYGARLLREEGRAPDVWKQVSETSRQQFRYLAEHTAGGDAPDVSRNLQRNLERVLDLEQQDRSELVGKPIPKDSPRARRPGDGEPGRRPGVGPPRGDQPGSGASGMMEMGDGW